MRTDDDGVTDPQDEWTISMTFQWLEEAAEFLSRMGVLQPCDRKAAAPTVQDDV